MRPRQIAELIAAQPTREARLQMLMNVRPEWQDLVRRHVEIIFAARGRTDISSSEDSGAAEIAARAPSSTSRDEIP